MSSFQQFVDLINRVPLKHTSDDFVHLSALYHQATLGDNLNHKPPVYDVVGCERWMKWANLKGMAKETAMQNYIEAAKAILHKEQPLVPSVKEDVVENMSTTFQKV